MNYADLFFLLVPEVVLTVAAFAALSIDMGLMRHRPVPARMRMGAVITTLAAIAAAGWIWVSDAPGKYHDGMFVIDSLTRLIQLVILLLTVFTAWIAAESNFTEHIGEYFALLLLATVGMMFLVSAENILMIFVSLELLSLSLYIMTAFNKRNVKSAEAALKYFLFGGMSAAFMLFGLSLVYGLSGELNLMRIAVALKGKPLDPLLIVAIVMVVVGFGFKVAAVPFHLWAPDAYQGAPTPSAAFIASGSKVASFYILAKAMIVGFAGAEGSGGWRNFSHGWVPLLAVIAVLSMMLGNLAAIAQSSVRRLLAYSAIAHAGYMLVGLLANNTQGMSSLIYYVATYALTTVGAFGVVAVVEERTGDDKFSAFAGLSKRAPLLAFCMMVFMLSLAGIPPLAGFFGKVYLFTAAVSASNNLGLLWLVIFAILMSAVSLYYYLQVLKKIFVTEPPADSSALAADFTTKCAIAALAAGVVVLGCAPNLLVGNLLEAIRLANLWPR